MRGISSVHGLSQETRDQKLDIALKELLKNGKLNRFENIYERLSAGELVAMPERHLCSPFDMLLTRV